MYDYRCVCPCGKSWHAPFKDKFHVHIELCSSCGASKTEMRVFKCKRSLLNKKQLEDPNINVWWKPWTWTPRVWGWKKVEDEIN